MTLKTITLNPDADSWLDFYSQNNNHGSDTKINVGTGASSGDLRHGIIRFLIPKYDGVISSMKIRI